MDSIRAQWLSHLASTAPADRPRAEAGLRQLYAAARLPGPTLFFRFGSPFRAAGAAALLAAASDSLWARVVEAMDRSSSFKSWMEALRSDMRAAANAPDWKGVVKSAGASLTPGMTRPGGPMKSLQGPVTMERVRLYKDVTSSAPPMDESDPLYRAERAFRSVLSGQEQWSDINPLLGHSFYSLMTYATFANDETELAGNEAPPMLAGLWEAAKSAGLWWPFENAVVISERPSELHLDDLSRPHHGDKPAFVFRDGERAWAWEGRAMRQEWIEHPEKIPPGEFKRFEKSFRDYMTTRMGRSPAGPGAPTFSGILETELAGPVEQKIAALRRHNNGRLPFHDRYVDGRHEEVWAELVALCAAVREDPHAADALAVAYETMRRVDSNVKTITGRLKAMRCQFIHEPRTPPDKKVGSAALKEGLLAF